MFDHFWLVNIQISVAYIRMFILYMPRKIEPYPQIHRIYTLGTVLVLYGTFVYRQDIIVDSHGASLFVAVSER